MATGRFPQPGDTGVVGTVMLCVPVDGLFLVYVDAFASQWATPDAYRNYPFAFRGNPLRFSEISRTRWNPGTTVLFDVAMNADGLQYDATNIRSR